jgi:apolipoprotein N-acyltransferase
MSAIFAPDGRTIASLPDYTAGAMLDNVPLSSTITPAMAIGRAIEWLVGGLGLAGLVLGFAMQWAGRRRHG